MTKTIQHKLNRWISLICCGTLSAVVWVIVGGALNAHFTWVSSHIVTIPSNLIAPIIFILVIAACWPFAHGRFWAFLGFRHLGGYPPLWISLFVSMVILSLITGYSDGWGSITDHTQTILWVVRESSLRAWGWIAVLSGASVVINRKYSTPRVSSPKNINDLDNLISWIQNDHEIYHPDFDFFDHKLIAKRISNRLSDAEDECPTIAVVGPLGSGKSSIRGLVEHYTEDDPSIQMLYLSLWPFDSAESAVSGILNAVMKSLGVHVNILAVSGLPSKYVTTIEKNTGRWGGLLNHLHGETDPKNILEELGKIASAAGIKIVVWLEDLERFSGADQLKDDAKQIREAERLGPIRSLLYLLDRCDSISVIVSDISLGSRFDTEKIARFIEKTPRLDPSLVWKKITMLRESCLSEDFIDPASEEYRKELTQPTDGFSAELWFWNLSENKPRVQESVVILTATPRVLKSALRLSWETWEKLRGEIDFDSVLIVSVLRAARPDVFAYIEENIAALQNGISENRNGFGVSEENHPSRVRFDKLMEKEHSDRSIAAIKSCISFVFPAAFEAYYQERSDYIGCPQGLRCGDNWEKYLASAAVDEADSDQAVLKTIATWKEGEPNGFIDQFVEGQKIMKFDLFVNQFSSADLCRLLKEVAAKQRDESSGDWDSPTEVHGIYPAYQMIKAKNPNSNDLKQALRETVNDLTSRHLPLSYSVLYTFTRNESGLTHLLGQDFLEEIDNLFVDEITKSFRPGQSKLLDDALCDGNPWTIRWICEFLDRKNQNMTSGKPFEGWEDFSNVLLELAESNPEKGIPQIIGFITFADRKDIYSNEDDGHVHWPKRVLYAEFREKFAKLFFKDYDRLLKIFASASDLENPTEILKACFEVAREYAQDALNLDESIVDNNDSDEKSDYHVDG